MTQSSQQATHSRPGEPHSRAVPTWRDAFDAMMRPLAIASEAWVQTDTFMNALAVTWKIQRQAARRFENGVAMMLRLGGVPSRSDILRVVNQVASLERQLREFAQVIEERS